MNTEDTISGKHARELPVKVLSTDCAQIETNILDKHNAKQDKVKGQGKKGIHWSSFWSTRLYKKFIGLILFLYPNPSMLREQWQVSR